MAARFDPFRSLLVALASALAFIAAFLDANDLSRSFQETVVPAFVVAGSFAAVLALLPGAQPWSTRRRRIAVIGAIAWAVAAFPILLFALAVSGCACSGGGPGYVLPTILGLGTPVFVLAALAGGPFLLLAAGTLPDRASRPRGNS